MLERIAALLLALAVLAEQAAGRSLPVRFLVLLAVRQADAIARDFVVGYGFDAVGALGSADALAVPDGHDPEHALHLAMSLRTLALIVQAIAAPDLYGSIPMPAQACLDAETLSRLQDIGRTSQSLVTAAPVERRDTS